MIPEDLIANLAAFCSNNGYDYISGSFAAFIPTPPDYDAISDEVELVISNTGKFLIWHNSEISGKLTGTFCRGAGGIENLLIGPQVDLKSKMAVVEGLAEEIVS